MPPPEEAEAAAPPRGEQEPLEAFVVRLARAKAAAVADAGGTGLLLACDTLGEVDGQALGKPINAADAGRMLRAISGREHRVVSGVCLWQIAADGLRREPLTGSAESRLYLPEIGDAFIDEYLASGLWEGKAGACGFQDGRIPLELVAGSPSNVVGLPLELVRAMLESISHSQ
ncbi:MAG: Maf-like protein YhdE [Planctomycetota bacterium]